MKSTARTVGTVMLIMILSRLMAFFATAVYITFFGVDNPEINIYTYAIKFPNIVFNILGTALTIVVIPIFAGYIAIGEKYKAHKFADNVISLSSIAILALSALGIIVAPYIVMLTGFRNEGYGFAVTALRIMIPVMFFYGLNYILQGILQSLGRFNMPALVSIPSSLIIILYVYVLGSRFGVMGLTVATFIGLSLQALILVPPLLRTQYRYKISFNYADEDVKRALKLILPILIGTSAYQLNMFFNITMTSRFKNTVTLMGFVQDTILYSVLAFIYSLTAVAFPRLTMLAARKDMDGFRDNLRRILKTVIYVLLPAAAGFISVRCQLINLLVGWGRITPENIGLASDILLFYSVGVIGIGIKEVSDRAFYSLNDTVRPAINGIVIMLVNIAAALFLIYAAGMGVLGIPFAYSISAVTGGIVIALLIRKKIGPFGGRDILLSLVKVASASVMMSAAVYCINKAFSGFVFGGVLADRVVKLFVPVLAGAGVYFFATCVLKVDEAVIVYDRLRGKIRIKEG